MTPTFVEIADGVHVLRYPLLDVNVTLVVGDGAALLVDTLSTAAQARELVAAARAVTPHPWTIVNTHHHFDHCFGNPVAAGDPPAEIVAHEQTALLLRDGADAVRREAYEEMLPLDGALAAQLAGAPVLAPTRTVAQRCTLDVGGRRVELAHLGRGHTAGDLVAHVPDADVLIAGDLVEEGAPPAFRDSFPLQWPETVAALLRLTGPGTTIVPGHGAVVDETFVRAQHADLVTLEWLIRDGYGDRVPAERVAARAPFGTDTALPAVRRGYAELDGRT
ncbi:Glyoxylase, beta-lactamase superfamily II [Micromonospora pattaloongensis]|uniref:Glyoxylase, beta-lactamase superfamily II n=1 Tax=Micromonospora pattaloongensis TaxID=405436 RepID=A0A1H3QE52_9ACTN|nr:MBL fold metallo-hydrolase [Micromonospora pattaloongensis]SDZ11570.1 Glyoxylase, beta-lactamase superfamily II [Micromonospora pattaloongensis]